MQAASFKYIDLVWETRANGRASFLANYLFEEKGGALYRQPLPLEDTSSLRPDTASTQCAVIPLSKGPKKRAATSPTRACAMVIAVSKCYSSVKAGNLAGIKPFGCTVKSSRNCGPSCRSGANGSVAPGQSQLGSMKPGAWT